LTGLTDAEKQVRELLAEAQRISHRNGITPERFISLFLHAMRDMAVEEIERGEIWPPAGGKGDA
jgi:hypothetical protein